MMKNTLIVSAILALIANASEEERNMDKEQLIISGLESLIPSNEKFVSYTSHLGKPAMHEEVTDGKHSQSKLSYQNTSGSIT